MVCQGWAGLRKGSHVLARKHIDYVDLEKIDRATESLNRQEQEIRARLSCEFKASLIANPDMDDVVMLLTSQQNTCVQRVLEGYTVREIAHQTGLSYGNIQSYLTAAMLKLRNYFQES